MNLIWNVLLLTNLFTMYRLNNITFTTDTNNAAKLYNATNAIEIKSYAINKTTPANLTYITNVIYITRQTDKNDTTERIPNINYSKKQMINLNNTAESITSISYTTKLSYIRNTIKIIPDTPIDTTLTNITDTTYIKTDVTNTRKIADRIDPTRNILNVTKDLTPANINNATKITANTIYTTKLHKNNITEIIKNKTYTTNNSIPSVTKSTSFTNATTSFTNILNRTKVFTKTTNSTEIVESWPRGIIKNIFLRSTTPGFIQRQEEAQQMKAEQDPNNPRNLSAQLRRDIEDEDWESDDDFMIKQYDGYSPQPTSKKKISIDLNELPALEVGPPRNDSYDPSYGYELYWKNGSWVATTRKWRYPDNVCGRICLPMYREYGVICARNKYYYYDTFENYCEMLSDDCGGQNGWTVAYPGECLEVTDPENMTGFINQAAVPGMEEFTHLWNQDYRGEG